ncbi:MAG: hypothetical protein IJD70_05140 [Clostridia bacterium]|nr:hypothetical protein [Clostridia bacterium]
MKNTAITRIFALIFAIIMTLSLASCGGEGGEETTLPIAEPAPETTLSPETTAEPDADLHIVSGGASEYVAIRPESAESYEIEAVKEIKALIKEKYGIDIKLDTDGKRKPGTDPEYQILCGKTDEPESADAIAYIESLGVGKVSFVIEAHEKRLVIVASNVSMYEAAIKYLEENFMKESGMTVPEGFRYTEEAETVSPAIHIDKDNELEVKMTKLYEIATHKDKNGVNCRIIQGACTDGEYLYTCLNDGAKSGAVTTIVKTELRSGKVVAKYEGIMIDHANDLTYNPKTKEILACHNSPNNQLVSIFDAETMEFKETIKLRENIYAIEYDEDEDRYWIGLSGSYDFMSYNAEFRKSSKIIRGYSNGFTKQGVDADDKYLYFVLYNTNCIAVYTKSGEYVRQIDLPVTAGEPENISHVGDTFYIVYNNPSWTGGIVYETVITEK